MKDIDPDYVFDEAEAESVHDSIERSTDNGVDEAFWFGAGAALGQMYAEDEQLDRDPLRDDGSEMEVVPLSDRFANVKNKNSRPVVRWLSGVAGGVKKISDPIDYTAEEMMRILDQEGLNE